MVRLKVVARVIPEDAYLAHVESSTKPIVYTGENKFALIVKEPSTWKIETLETAIRDKYMSLYKIELGSIKHLKDDANDCDLDPEDTLSDALIDEGKAQVDNSDQNVTISVIQEQSKRIQNAPMIENSTPASSSTMARPPAAQISVPRFEDLESPLGKRKRVLSPENDGLGEHQLRLPRKRNKIKRSKNLRTSLASESKSQSAQLASPTPSMPISEAVNSVSSQVPPSTAQPLTWHLNQARNMQLSLKDLNRVIIADSASNSTINSPAIEADKTPFQQAARPLFGADDNSDDSSDESSDEEPAQEKGANGGSKAVASGQGRGLPVPDPTIRDETDEDEDEDSD